RRPWAGLICDTGLRSLVEAKQRFAKSYGLFARAAHSAVYLQGKRPSREKEKSHSFLPGKARNTRKRAGSFIKWSLPSELRSIAAGPSWTWKWALRDVLFGPSNDFSHRYARPGELCRGERIHG